MRPVSSTHIQYGVGTHNSSNRTMWDTCSHRRTANFHPSQGCWGDVTNYVTRTCKAGRWVADHGSQAVADLTYGLRLGVVLPLSSLRDVRRHTQDAVKWSPRGWQEGGPVAGHMIEVSVPCTLQPVGRAQHGPRMLGD